MKAGARTDPHDGLLYKWFCNRCGHYWNSRPGHPPEWRPSACAHCCSPWWDKPRKYRRTKGEDAPDLKRRKSAATFILPPPNTLAMWAERILALQQACGWSNIDLMDHFECTWPTIKRVLDGKRPMIKFVRKLKELEALHAPALHVFTCATLPENRPSMAKLLGTPPPLLLPRRRPDPIEIQALRFGPGVDKGWDRLEEDYTAGIGLPSLDAPRGAGPASPAPAGTPIPPEETK